MQLTKSEIEIADRYISKRERQLAQWPLRRWLMLVIFSVFALVGYRNEKVSVLLTIDTFILILCQ